jgi:Tol biopolymer transport system component
VKWGAPKWSPYGDEFVVSAPPITTGYGEIFHNIDDGFPYVGGNDLFLINTKGEIRRISYITTTMAVGEEEFSWSPNGKQIAFWLYFLDDSFDESYLAIVDIETGVTTNLCLKGFGEISWSPDGKYLGFTSIVSESGQDDYFGVIVDIDNNQGYYIPEKGYIDGWMKP